jgi:hypothetical protein
MDARETYEDDGGKSEENGELETIVDTYMRIFPEGSSVRLGDYLLRI